MSGPPPPPGYQPQGPFPPGQNPYPYGPPQGGYPQGGPPQGGYPQQPVQQPGYGPAPQQGPWQQQPPYPAGWQGGFAPYPPPPRQPGRRGLVVTIVAAAVVLVAVVAGAAVALRGDGGGTHAAVPGADVTVQQDTSVVVAESGVTGPTLEIYEDFQCPACRQFEQASGATISQLVAQGQVRVVYRPIRLFNTDPQAANSERAADAAACAPGEHWLDLHGLLFQNQPAEGSDGFSTTQLVDLGRQAGITDQSFADCVNGSAKDAAVKSATSAAFAAGVQGTPTLKLNGRDLDSNTAYDPSLLSAAIAAAGSAGGSGGGSGASEPPNAA